ncbi:T9SS type A sorting domain-containing protein [Chryseobacterium chendengshani]|uniref:T9SS type A sorting domain-containing protein n=1 Tax=Chryseobacterium sp. LJ668 TaxID=2864040 RepID=UPI001C69363F|nr:T9SS type A sorting domain-containing protein [Chryseobacterium sp. LJ668]MBW8522760.1 T9SS type A sorting domain-containing protein [Chryseobacterium sp. LJ668]QYK16293.1 T9SS type A sorting domain-containing protein [Chryseobacterium sp. LJ668]
MRTKLFFVLFAISFSNFYHTQSNFPYEREWGSYVGATGTYLGDFNFPKIAFFTDTQSNLYVNGKTSPLGYSTSYYNQFVNGAGNPFNSTSENLYSAKFSTSGQMLKGSYDGITNSFERTLGIDSSDNKYTLKIIPGQVTGLATAGVWLTQNTDPLNTSTSILTKYDINNNVIWATYIPNHNNNSYLNLRIDTNQNVYLLGQTQSNIAGLGTPGVMQESFVNYFAAGSQASNSYLVKLNSSGQKIWGTFSAAGIRDYKIYNNEIYMVTNYSPIIPGNFDGIGTFQPNLASTDIIFKLNANTGQKIWSTFYGPPINQSFAGDGINGIEVNETGIYVSGQTGNINHSTYFATAGAFKSQLTGERDLFLSKFDFSGNRIWSTYFGSNGKETCLGRDNITVLGNRIIITGNQVGAVNNISTTGAFLTTIPNTNTSPLDSNMFFTEFDTNGNRLWTSYYGSTGNNFFGEYLNAKLLNNGSLVLWGTTGSLSNIGTEGASFQFVQNPLLYQPYGFITKFNLKDQLGTTDLDNEDDLQLYDNPNNGNFSMSGNILEKQKASLSVFDMSGKLIHQASFEKKKTNQFNLDNKLIKGNYLLEVVSEKGEKMKVFKMTVK